MTSDDYAAKLEESPEVFASTLAGTYTYFASYATEHDEFSLMGILHGTDMMTEDIVQAKSTWFTYDYCLEFNQFNYRRPYATWEQLYTPISQVNNDVINGMNVKEVMEDPKSSLRPFLGEAYAIRAFCYMYLVQIFQNPFTAEPDASGAKINYDAYAVPIKYSSIETQQLGKATNNSRNTVKDVFNMIETDLKNAVELLNGAPARATKMSINQQVAQGLLARYYLMVGNWQEAAANAKAARSGYKMLSETELLEGGFMDLNLSDVMWGFDHDSETQTTYASFFSHISNLAPGYAGLEYAPRLIDKRLYEQIPETDFRKRLFNGKDKNTQQTQNGAQWAYANLKFGWDGNWTMDYIYMRAAEMVLIEAEALARMGDANATTVLKELLDARFEEEWRATDTPIIDEIILQRRIELWGEGFGYFDLKRLHRGIDRNYDGSNHRKPDGLLTVPAGDSRWTYQIPEREMQENTEIKEEHQNK